LQKFNKLSQEQAFSIFTHAIEEIDRFKTILDSITLGLLVCNEQHKLLLTNKSAEHLLLIDDYDEGAEPVWFLIKDQAIEDFLCQALPSGDRVEDREFLFSSKNKPNRLLNFNVLPLVKEYKVIGSLIIVEDITGKKTREENIRRVENLASLTTLAAGVAHEIKNPLGSMSIHIHLLQKILEKDKKKYEEKSNAAPAYEDIANHLSVLNEEIDRLNRIVVDFLFAVRPMDLTLVSGNINTLIRDILSFVQYELDELHIICVSELQNELPLVDFDRHYMKQALLNLVKNAIEAMSPGGILTIKTEVSDNGVVISIGDTGSGISEENQAKIFEPYFTTKNMGTGLGLTLVFKIIQEHKGEIALRSGEGRGTVFIITLPISRRQRRLLN
jgi:signal transduction histidine kinase